MHRPLDLPARLSTPPEHPTRAPPRPARAHEESPLRADPAAQLRLLDLQAVDARADQLRHQRSSLPEIAELVTVQASRRELDDQRRDLQVEVDDLTAEQRKVDRDVEQVKARRARDQDRMDRGLVGARDLQHLQEEMVSLQRRITSLEDDELEVMEKLEEAQAVLAGVVDQVTLADERVAELTASRDRRTGELDEDLAEVAARRAPLVADVPADLLALYDRLRAQKGIAVAELRQRRCGGCQLGIDHAELSAIRAAPAEEVVRCEECSRIMVRTAESGL